MMASAEPERPRLEAADGVEQVLPDIERLDRTFQLGREMEAPTQHFLVTLL